MVVTAYCVYCGHPDNDHKVTELPGDRSRDIWVDGRLCLPHRPYRQDCHCGCDEFRWDLERAAADYAAAGEALPFGESEMLVFSLQVFDLPKFIEVYSLVFGEPRGGLWDAEADLAKYRKRVSEGIIKPREHHRPLRELAQEIYGQSDCFVV